MAEVVGSKDRCCWRREVTEVLKDLLLVYVPVVFTYFHPVRSIRTCVGHPSCMGALSAHV